MKILIINSCGKAKLNSFDGQAGFDDLKTQVQRENYQKEYSSRSVMARDLYIGQQAQAIATSVDLLRNEGNLVDYYIISAGFGLLKEDDIIPPYDVTFSSMKSKTLRNHANELNIERDISELPDGYDMIYLALGKSYLKTFNPKILRNKGKTIIHFDRSSKFESIENFFKINENDLIGNDDQIPEIPDYIGNLVQSKGNIIRNWVLYNQNQSTQLPFPDWWLKVLKSLKQENKNKQNSVLKESEVVKYNQLVDNVRQKEITNHGSSKLYMTGYVLMAVDKNVQEVANEIVNKLTDDDQKEIYNAHYQLSPRDAKKDTRKDWVEKYQDREDQIVKWATWFEDKIEEIQEETDSSKVNSRKALVNAIREYQENQGWDEYLINPVRISLFATFKSYLDDPEKLEKSPEYTPQKSKHGIEMFNDDFKFEITSTDDTSLTGKITNSSSIPRQNVELILLDKSGNKLMIANAIGENFNPTNDSVQIPFILAPLNDKKEIKFKIEINGFYDFEEDPYTMKIIMDDPFQGVKVEKEYPYD